MSQTRLPPATSQFRQTVRTFYVWLLSLVAAVVLPVVAFGLVDRPSPVTRAAGVALGLGGFVPYILVILAIIRRGDEFHQRIHLVATSMAFVISLVILMALAWLADAGFMRPPALREIWVAIALIWAACTFTVNYRYKRQA